MTIKQQGGVFGRHPSFESIELNGQDLQAELNAKADLTGDTFTGQVNVNVPTAGGVTVTSAGNGEIIAARTAGASVKVQAQSAAGNIGTTSNHRFDLLSNGSARLRIETNANVNVLSGNLVIGTSGKGIDFSATSGTGTSELFDDYEEGTFTPAFAAASGAFTTLTYSLQHGNYTKIGNTVRVQIGIATSEVVVGTASGNVSITGLPFAQSSTFNTGEAGSIGYMMRFATSMPEIKTFINHTNSEIKFDKASTTATSSSQLQVTDLKTGASPFNNYMAVSFVYKTA